ncbi:MAG: glycosyltransferase [Elainella sp. Prado103]|jgi:glycosyltransferase involved in cell wall biosynthesis|nr:glycosyltransferase [Elainella sp. Prado103]
MTQPTAAIAYLVNQYPKVSHSFIRREILALEQAGIPVLRFSIRSRAEELVDAADQQELAKTRFILQVGALGLLFGLLKVSLSRPIAFLQALRATVRLSRRSEQGLAKHFAYLAEACVLLGWLQQSQVRHLHVHFGTNSTTVALLCRMLGGPPYSFTVHGPEEFDKVKMIALPEKIDRAAFVVAISQFGKSQLYRWCPAAQWDKIHVVRCGVDEVFLGQPLTPIPDRPQLVCVGRLCEDKGQLLLVEAVRRLRDEGLPIQLILVGDGELRSEIEARIARDRLESQIQITGWASSTEVRSQITAARAFVLPSFAEGLPVVIMEALALGRPVISTTIAGIPELVTPDCGWLVPPSSIEALVDAMRSVLQQPIETLTALGQQGAKRVAAQHDAQIESRKLVDLFRQSLMPTALQPTTSLLSGLSIETNSSIFRNELDSGMKIE